MIKFVNETGSLELNMNLSKVLFDKSNVYDLLKCLYEKSLQDIFPNI
jgi:hypothetical protein